MIYRACLNRAFSWSPTSFIKMREIATNSTRKRTGMHREEKEKKKKQKGDEKQRKRKKQNEVNETERRAGSYEEVQERACMADSREVRSLG